MKDLKVIAFDADDTLWVNEPFFHETEQKFCVLLEDYLPAHTVAQELYKTELKNLALYGYGVKGFMLSMIETLNRITEGTAQLKFVQQVIDLGHELLHQPVILLEGVETVLKALNGHYRLVMATKGDLLDQERKLIKSGLAQHFHHIEIMSDKQEKDYHKLIRHLDIKAEQFLMVGNSIKSDVLPVLALGGYAVHVPYHTTWIHEKVDAVIENERFLAADNILELLKMVQNV